MAEQPKDPKSPKGESEKKVPETVLLTAEELRAIAGGAGVSHGPGTSGKVIVAEPKNPNPGH